MSIFSNIGATFAQASRQFGSADAAERNGQDGPLSPRDLPAPGAGNVRVMTWNLGQGASFTNGGGVDHHQLDTVARDIADSGADVVMVQEIYRNDLTTLERELEAATGREVYVTFSDASTKHRFDERNPFSIFRAAAGEDFGNAVISFAPQEEIVDQQLTHDGDEGRTVLGVEIDVGGQPVRLYTTHVTSQGTQEVLPETGPPTGTTTTTLPGDVPPPEPAPTIHDPQVAQIGEVFATADGDGPMILGGDFNVALDASRPSAATINTFDDFGYTDAAADAGPTSDQGEGRRIDYVFTEGVDVVRSYVMEAGPSDHAAVVVDVRIPGALPGAGSGGGGGGSTSW